MNEKWKLTLFALMFLCVFGAMTVINCLFGISCFMFLANGTSFGHEAVTFPMLLAFFGITKALFLDGPMHGLEEGEMVMPDFTTWAVSVLACSVVGLFIGGMALAVDRL